MKEFTDYDYQDLVRRMTDVLSKKEGWGEGYQSSQGQMLIELVADATDALHYMLERRTSENYFQTAKLRQSCIAKASDLGYRVKRMKANEGRVMITIRNTQGDPVPAANNVIIPKFTSFKFGDRDFLTVEETVIEIGETSTEVLVKEGRYSTNTYTLSDENIIIIPDYENIERDGIFVSTASQGEFMDVVKHDNVNKRALTFLKYDDKCYDIRYNFSEMEMMFGDGIFGTKPDGDIIVGLIRTEINEPILIVGKEFEHTGEPIQDSTGIVYDVSVTTTTQISGGEDIETIESIRRNASIYNRTNGRATTDRDYEYWVMESGIGLIRDVRASGEHDYDSVMFGMNNIFINYLTQTGERLSLEDEEKLRAYMKAVKTAGTHLVLNEAGILDLMLSLDVRKNPSLTMSEREFYAIIYRFLVQYFELRENTIGREVQHSDIIKALYDIKVDSNGIDVPAIDFCKLDMNAVYDFSFPLKSNKVFLKVSDDYTPANGDNFVINLDNLTCSVPVESTDSVASILLKMRDKVMELTPFAASVDLSGLLLDGFGNPMTAEIDPIVGENLLIGVDTPYYANTYNVGDFTVGSTIAKIKLDSDAITFTHSYYSQPAGRRPRIPLRVGTTVTFTAPSDSNVKVYLRTDMHVPATETLSTTITAGTTYTRTFNDEFHSVQFEYESNSSEDAFAVIEYPTTTNDGIGLTIRAIDNFGNFGITTTSGDLANFTSVDHSITLPYDKRSKINNISQAIERGSLSVCYKNTNIVLYTDDGNGRFLSGTNTMTSGRVDYETGEIFFPHEMPSGNFYIKYKQNAFDNFNPGQNYAIRLIAPKPSLNSPSNTLSTIRIV